MPRADTPKSDPVLTDCAKRETLDTLESEQLRSLICASREILRARGLIPDSVIRKKYHVRLQDLKDLRVAAFRFGLSPAGMADQCLGLLASPQLVVSVQTAAARERLFRMIDEVQGRNKGVPPGEIRKAVREAVAAARRAKGRASG